MKQRTGDEVMALAEIAALIREERERRKLTQNALAQSADVSRRYLVRVENGANVSVLLLIRILRPLGLGISVSRNGRE